jgi:tetratricopeptide (TPR) repeat protein
MLIGLALNERGQFEHAARELDCVRQEASKASIPRLAALAGTNLAISYEAIGRLEDALQASTEALPILVRLDNQVGLVKLQWHLGDVLRKLGKESEAIKAYGNACKNAERVGVRGDVAALHLVVAELLLDMGLDSEAEQEVRAALPIIDEEKMVPEGFAALSLLRESLRRRKLDRGALRTLHGYFKE